MQDAEGFNEASFTQVHQSGSQITSVRFNPAKFSNQQLTFNIEEKIPWSINGRYLPERPSFTLDPLFHAGAYYVQEASSMFLEEAIKQTVDLTKPLKVLDLCAAPGGKSTLIQSLISKASILVSNEVIKTRVNILAENMTKWGAANTIVTNNDPKEFQRLPEYFDVIVVDAPCSGSGLFRKDPAAINEWSEHNVALCAQRQQRILADIMPSLKEHGVLIYSTCSYSRQEDEAIADWLIEEFTVKSVKLKVEDGWGIVESVSEKGKAFGYRFYPDKVKGEGFFIAVFQKKQAGESTNSKQKNGKVTNRLSPKEIEVLRPYLKNADDFYFIRQHDEVLALPLQLETELPVMQSALYIKKAGVKLGTIIRNELIPAHDLALSTIINRSHPSYEVDEATALQYLRKGDFNIDAPKNGWLMISYQQLPLGWIKVIGNRTNNYYPKDWRILNK